jgi:pimeloyl-ACP methyl ester carboxylesterase
VPTAIICGTADRITPIDHSRRLHAQIAGSTLLECQGAGHLVILERHDEVDEELDRLLAKVGEDVGEVGPR